MSELAWLALWAALFVAQHLGVTSSGLRARLVGAVGEKAYLGLYSVVSIGVLVLLIRAYNATAPSVLLWPTHELLRWIPLLLMPLALLLVIGGVLARNPSTVGMVLDDGEEVPVTGVLRITRHPVQCGILIWSLSHMLANGDLPSLLFFGAFARGLGLRHEYSSTSASKASFGESWSAFREATSVGPVRRHRSRAASRSALSEIGWLTPVLAAAVFIALWWGHVWIAGAPVGLGW